MFQYIQQSFLSFLIYNVKIIIHSKIHVIIQAKVWLPGPAGTHTGRCWTWRWLLRHSSTLNNLSTTTILALLSQSLRKIRYKIYKFSWISDLWIYLDRKEWQHNNKILSSSCKSVINLGQSIFQPSTFPPQALLAFASLAAITRPC